MIIDQLGHALCNLGVDGSNPPRGSRKESSNVKLEDSLH